MKIIKCKICRETTIEFTDPKTKKNYNNCPNCAFIFLNTSHLPTPDEELHRYQLHDNTADNEGYVSMFKDFIKKTITPLKKSGTVLDFGCGPHPVLSSVLTDMGYSCDYYDKYFHPEECFKDKKYDIIIATEVIEHLRDPLKILNLLSTHLNDDGIICLMTLFHPENVENFLKWWYKNDITHISFYSYTTFTHIAQILNCKILYTDMKNKIVLAKNPLS